MPIKIKNLVHITGKEFLNLDEANTVLLDVRPEYELTKFFHVPNIIFCPYTEIDERINEIPNDKTIVVADAVGLRSKQIAKVLIENGFKNIQNLIGGIVEWEKDALPIETDKKRVLTGSCMCQLKPRNK